MTDERGNDGGLDGRLDDVLRRMTDVGDVDVEASAARVMARVGTQAPQRESRRSSAERAVPRLAWIAVAATLVCATAGGALWLATRPTSPSPVTTATPPVVAQSQPSPPRQTSVPSPAPASETAARLAQARPRGAAPNLASVRQATRPSASAGDTSGLPPVAPIPVASIDPEPLPAPTPLTTTPVAPASIDVDPILVDPVFKPAQEPGES